MRALIVNSILDTVRGGGTAEKAIQLSRAVADDHVEVTLLGTNAGLQTSGLVIPGVTVVTVPIIVERFYVPLIGVARLRQLVERVDVLLIMSHWTLLNAAAYVAARQSAKPYVVLPAGALPLFGRSRLLKQAFNVLVGIRMIRDADAWIATTAREVSDFAPYGVPAEAITVIPNAVDPDAVPPLDHEAFRRRVGTGSAPLLLFMGRLNQIKGPDLLLRAFRDVAARFPEYHLIIAGSDEGMQGELRRQALQDGTHTRVHLVGHLEGHEKWHAYAAADVLVVPSRQEAMSIVALEAGLVARPVVVTTACGLPDLEEIGAGATAQPSVEGLASALTRLLVQRERLSDMGARWRRYVLSSYGWSSVAEKYLGIFESVVAQRACVPGS